MAGENLPLVGKLLGHRRHRTTAGYAHLDDAHLVDATEKVEPSSTHDARLSTGHPYRTHPGRADFATKPNRARETIMTEGLTHWETTRLSKHFILLDFLADHEVYRQPGRL